MLIQAIRMVWNNLEINGPITSTSKVATLDLQWDLIGRQHRKRSELRHLSLVAASRQVRRTIILNGRLFPDSAWLLMMTRMMMTRMKMRRNQEMAVRNKSLQDISTNPQGLRHFELYVPIHFYAFNVRLIVISDSVFERNSFNHHFSYEIYYLLLQKRCKVNIVTNWF